MTNHGILSSRSRPVALALVALFAGSVLLARVASSQSPPTFNGVLTFHNDNLRTGQNLGEIILTTSNVNPAQFGLLFRDSVDGEIYAEPLYVPSVAVSGQGMHNVVFVATENDTLYAFDADSQGSPLWSNHLVPSGGTAIPSSDTKCGDLTPQIGITGTPVIDPSANTLFVVTATKENGTYVHRLHALDIRSGAELSQSPVVIQGSLSSVGPNATNGEISVTAFYNNQRPALLLDNGVIYIAFSSHCDFGPYNGWVLGYNETSLSQVALFSVDPNGQDSGIWMSGGGLATDSSGDVYLSTGNGTFDANTAGGADYGDSFLRLTPSGNSFSVNTYFTPNDQASLSKTDSDLGSGALLLLPDQAKAPVHLAIGAGKQNMMFLVNRDAMGGYQRGPNGSDLVIQEVTGSGGLWSAPAYFNNNVYVVPAGGNPQQLTLSGGKLSNGPVHTFGQSFPFNGATPSISANGTTNGIVWMIQKGPNANAALFALDATNISNEFYDSTQFAADTAGPFNKFQVPTVANGKVYVGTQTELDVYGELATARPTPTPSPAPSPTPTPANMVTVSHVASGTAHPGTVRAGGTFMVNNSAGSDESISAVTITFSNPALFKSASVSGIHGSASRSASAKPPVAVTTFTFKSPLKLPKGKNATFHLQVNAAKGATASSDQMVTGVVTSPSFGATGLPGDLGTVSPPEPK